MNADQIFALSGPVAIAGWVALLASPWMQQWSDRLATTIVPALLSVAYVGLILVFWSGAEGGFDTLDNVGLLFETRELLLAGWLHYLAFDLFVGAWIVRTARAEATERCPVSRRGPGAGARRAGAAALWSPAGRWRTGSAGWRWPECSD